MTIRPRLTLSLPTCGRPAADGPGPLVQLAKRAEDLGVDAVAVAEHVALGADTSGYPWGTFPLPSDAPFLEPLTTLMAIATVTQRLRLTTGVLIAPLRRAAVLAKTIATLDVMSGGRAELGVGVGWHEGEYIACGVDFAKRGSVLDDVIGGCRALWSDKVASFASETVTFNSVSSVPLPVQQPLPVLFAGSLHPRNVQRIVRTGDGWIPVMGSEAATVAEGIKRLRVAILEHGRDPSSLIIRLELPLRSDDHGHPDVKATLSSVPELIEVGVTDIQFPMPYFLSDLNEAEEMLEQVVTAWDPYRTQV
jgi:probable F420-dependent oxidoreductase